MTCSGAEQLSARRQNSDLETLNSELRSQVVTLDSDRKEIEEELAHTKRLLAELKQRQRVAIAEAADMRIEILKAKRRSNPP